MSAPATWRARPEQGTVLGIRFVAALLRAVGRPAAVAFVGLLSVYYTLLDGRVRRASRAYLKRVGLPAGLRSVVAHVFTFARVALDRVLFLTGRTARLEVHVQGAHLMTGIRATKRGCLMLGSHVGSFEAMGALATTDGVRLAVLVYTRNAQRIQRVLGELAPSPDFQVFALDPTRPTTMLDVKAFVDGGGMVALLADRVTDSEARAAEVTFLGGRALLPTGPYLLAHMLACPVYTFAALFSPPNRYDIHCEPFADKVVLPRETRAEEAQRLAQQYAEQLERYVALAPYNWFNFFEFWQG